MNELITCRSGLLVKPCAAYAFIVQPVQQVDGLLVQLDHHQLDIVAVLHVVNGRKLQSFLEKTVIIAKDYFRRKTKIQT